MPRVPRKGTLEGRSEARRSPELRRALKRLGQRVRALRRDEELTQERAAEKAGLDVKHWQAIESGESNITIASLVGIAKACGASLSDLFEGV